jgi:hypothetical protein
LLRRKEFTRRTIWQRKFVTIAIVPIAIAIAIAIAAIATVGAIAVRAVAVGAIAIAICLTTSGQIQHPPANDNIHFVDTDIPVVSDFVIANILSLNFPFFFATNGMLQQQRLCQWPKVAKPGHTT